MDIFYVFGGQSSARFFAQFFAQFFDYATLKRSAFHQRGLVDY